MEIVRYTPGQWKDQPADDETGDNQDQINHHNE